MNVAKQISHFTRNQKLRAEPDWLAPLDLPAGVLAPVLHFVEPFRLGAVK